MTTTTVPTTSELTDDTVAEPTPTRRPRGRRLLMLAAVVVSMASMVGIAGTAGAATGRTGTHYRSKATCQAISPVMGTQDRITVAAPVIYAANTTSRVDAQVVKFRQRLVRWNGSSWVAAGSSKVWSGFATDTTAALDFGDGTRTLRRPQITFTAGKGYYAVVTDYWWAATSYTAGGSDAAYATHSPSSSTSYCAFSA